MRSSSRVLSASVLALAAVAALSGCASLTSGPPVTQQRDIADVDAVQLNTSGNLTVTLGATPSLTVTAGDRIIDHLTEVVDDGVLRLGMEGEPMLLDGDIRYELTVSSLESLTVDGSGDASIDLSGATEPAITVRGSGDVEASGIDATEATLTIEGSGAIEVQDAAAEHLAVRVDGSGEVTVDGVVDTQRVEIIESGGYHAADLRSTDAFVTVRGSGSATVTADGTLDAVDGSGAITHSGDADVTKEVIGSGEITRR